MRSDQMTRLALLVNDATRARAVGDVQTALAIADQAARDGLSHPALMRIQAEALRNSGRIADAGRLLNHALSIAPDDAVTIVEIGRLLVAEERTDEAITAFKAALAVQPDFLDAWLALGAAYAGSRDLTRARVAFRRATELAPRDPAPRASLAFLEVREGRLDAARTWANEALGLQPDHALASLTLACVDVDERAFEPARARLEALVSGEALNKSQRQFALGQLADALHGLGRTQEAFATYSRLKETFARQNEARYGDQGPVENHLGFVRRLSAWFERQDRRDWSQPIGDEPATSPVRRHVFLLGYLRSGVTLVESILATLPDTRVLEEGETLMAADRAFLRNDQTLDKLNPLDPESASLARADYWRRVREQVPDVDGKIFVDMSPLYGIKLPMIARLFPDALVVLCRRDPRDVVLSCFRRNFSPNALTFQMTSLEKIARHYDAAMRLTELHRQVLPIPFHVVEYSRLIGDFEATTRALADFVGARWTEQVREFSRTAAERKIRTPSAQQVRRGLFDGTGQWRQYREHMEPVLPILEPWVAEFGYEP
jgi:Flp pilus assembly protein TadD